MGIKNIGKEEIEKILDFIRARSKGFNGIVIGMSGGIDSSVTAVLCTKAIGSKKVLALMLPFGRQSTEDAKYIAFKFGIDFKIVNIKPIVESFLTTFNIFKDKKSLGNLMARIRMCLLYGVANSQKRLVVGSGNKSEILTGYFTRYGDGGVDILPIGDLYKTQIFQLAKILGIPERILKKKPSAELWEGQTDEEELGISYKHLDLILYELVDKGKHEDDIKIDGISKGEIKKVVNMFEKSKFKRKMPDICYI